jgi:hypothetical protein
MEVAGGLRKQKKLSGRWKDVKMTTDMPSDLLLTSMLFLEGQMM